MTFGDSLPRHRRIQDFQVLRFFSRNEIMISLLKKLISKDTF